MWCGSWLGWFRSSDDAAAIPQSRVDDQRAGVLVDVHPWWADTNDRRYAVVVLYLCAHRYKTTQQKSKMLTILRLLRHS